MLTALQEVEGKLREAQSQSQEYGDAVSRSADLVEEATVLETQVAAARARASSADASSASISPTKRRSSSCIRP